MINHETELMGGKWEVTFKDEGSLIEYNFEIDHLKRIIKEEILIDKFYVLKRNIEENKIYSSLTEEFQEFYPPINLLTIHSRRDSKEYPFLEIISDLAKNVFGFKFNNMNPRFYKSEPQHFDGLTSFDSIFTLIRFIKEKGEDTLKFYLKTCCNDLNQVGYRIKDIIFEQSDLDSSRDIINIFEGGFEFSYPHFMTSQGMFRSLTLILFTNYLLIEHLNSTILIDDFGEGLDYERATKLGKLIYDKIAEEPKIQFIASSNDSFLMDIIDINFWNILHREGGKVKAYNYENSKEKFEEFRFTGLSNFDLFSSNYLLSVK